jgi:DNA primase catalytic subunit
MRPATLKERREFYEREFRLDLVRRWFRGWTRPIVFAVMIGRHTKIFPDQYRSERDQTILIDEYDTIQDVRRYCLEFLPEAVYYDRSVYKSWEEARRSPHRIEELGESFGQQLAFDIDPENFECPLHGTLEDKMNKRQGLSFCRLELQLAQQQSIELAEDLAESFAEIQLVYSGRGFHVHILDEDTFFWTRKQRLTLIRSLVRRGYVTDDWVAGGGMRLIRLPHSLNGLVSRVTLPLNKAEADSFDPFTDKRSTPVFARR